MVIGLADAFRSDMHNSESSMGQIHQDKFAAAAKVYSTVVWKEFWNDNKLSDVVRSHDVVINETDPNGNAGGVLWTGQSNGHGSPNQVALFNVCLWLVCDWWLFIANIL